jgi:hypothetical protein
MHRETLKETKGRRTGGTKRDEKQRQKQRRFGGHLSIPLPFSAFE